jgi:formylglycine-generating enzyme required for sulfatase activity
MKITLSSAVGAALILLAPLAEAADPEVSNISAVQRAGTRLVDITYDVTADTDRVFRGGFWGGDASGCRVAFRASYDPSGTYGYIGFRIARSSVP